MRARGAALKAIERPIDTGTAAAKGRMLSIDQAQVEKLRANGPAPLKRDAVEHWPRVG